MESGKQTIADKFRQGLRDSTTLRLLVVAAAVLFLSWVTYAARGALRPAEVQLPDRDFHKLPLQLGVWKGVDTALDPNVFRATGAADIVNRNYLDGRSGIVSLHMAVFKDPDEGVYHRPDNCYVAQNFRKVDETRLPLNIPDDPDAQVVLITWAKEKQQVLVAYWYKFGEHLVFDRATMGTARLQMRGQQVWPALVKVMIQSPVADPKPTEEEIERVRGFAVLVYRWLGAPDDQTAAANLAESAGLPSEGSQPLEGAGQPSETKESEPDV